MTADALTDANTWVALLTLTGLELILGIDNIVFIAILTDRLPEAQRPLAYRLGLGAAMLSRLALLASMSWVMGLTEPWITLLGRELSGRSVVLILGGIFLVGKSSHEMYRKVEQLEDGGSGAPREGRAGLAGTVAQIMVLDIVFSLDSVITAVGMAEHFWIMAAAVVLAVALMLAFARQVGDFVNSNPAMKILALSFLLLIGVLLTAEGLGQHIDKGYIYSAMGFSLLVQLLNMRLEGNAAHRSPGGDP